MIIGCELTSGAGGGREEVIGSRAGGDVGETSEGVEAVTEEGGMEDTKSVVQDGHRRVGSELDADPRMVEIEPAREEPLELQDREGEDTGKSEKKT